MQEQKPETYEIALATLDIIPLVMRVMAAEMRSATFAMADGQAPVLGLLQYRPYTLGDLAERLSVSPPTMSSTVNTLEQRGWVARRRDDHDRRLVWIAITSEGQAVLDNMQRQVAERIAHLLVDLSPPQREMLSNGLIVLRDVFAAALEQDPVLREVADEPKPLPRTRPPKR